MSSQHAFSSRHAHRRACSFAGGHSVIEGLESRTMFNATQTSPVSPIQLAPGTTSTLIDLSQHFTDPSLTGTPVVIDTSQGVIPLVMLDTVTPKTVNNFLSYIAAGAYNGTVVQRAVPNFILQGGGFNSDGNHIATGQPVPNEFGVSNTAGTIAMALSTDPNTHIADPASATSDWFINDADNASILDPQKFTVFGKVIYDGMTVVNKIEALPKGSVSPNFVPSSGDPVDGVLPLQGYNTGSPIHPSNYVISQAISQVQPVLFTVTSDDSSLVTAVVNGSSMTITAGAGTGLAHITITAIDLGGNQVQQVLPVQVGSTQVVLGKGAARSVNFTDPDGTRSTITYGGNGLATISFTGLNLSAGGTAVVKTLTGTPLAVTVTTTGTSANSTIAITGKGGTNKMVDIAGMQLGGPMRSIIGVNTNLTANLNDASSVAVITLGTVTSSNINLGAGAPVRLTVGSMNTSSLFATSAVTAVNAKAWTGGGVITATTIGQVNIKGTFTGGFAGKTLNSFTAGAIGAGSWNLTGAVGRISAKGVTGWQATLGSLGTLINLGAMTSSRLNTSGGIKSVTAASMTDSRVLCAVPSGSLPTSNSDFSSIQTIGSIVVKGAYVGSEIAAATITNLAIGPITPSNGGSIFGVAALGAKGIKTFKFGLAGKTITLRKVTSEEQVLNVFSALSVAPQDFAAHIL